MDYETGYWFVNNQTLIFGSNLVTENNDTYNSSQIYNGNQAGEYKVNLTFEFQSAESSRLVSLEISNDSGKTKIPINLAQKTNYAILGIGIAAIATIVIFGGILLFKPLKRILETQRPTTTQPCDYISSELERTNHYSLSPTTITSSKQTSMNDVT